MNRIRQRIGRIEEKLNMGKEIFVILQGGKDADFEPVQSEYLAKYKGENVTFLRLIYDSDKPDFETPRFVSSFTK